MKLIIDRQRIYPYGAPEVIADDSIEFVLIEFMLSFEWTGYDCTVQFTQNGHTYNKHLVNGAVTLPSELTAGQVEISVFGVLPGHPNRGTTQPYIQKIVDSGFSSTSETPIPPTPDLYSQLIEAVGSERTRAEAAAERADASASNAATSAENAEKAKQVAINNADDAEAAANNAKGHATTAGTWAGHAETSASNAEKAAGNAAASAEASAQSAVEAAASAQEAQDTAEAMTEDVVGSDGRGGLYIITCNGMKANRTQAEIRAAVQARKTVLLRAGTRVYTYFQETQSSNYDEAAAGKTCPTFIRPARQEDGGLRYYEVQVHEDNTITDRGSIGKTPNPNKLTFSGAVEAEYDGSAAVNVEIPDMLVVTSTIVDGEHKANYTSTEFRAAHDNNIPLLVISNTVYTFCGYESMLPKFARPAFVASNYRIRMEYATIGTDGFITKTFVENGVRNPFELTFTGAATATYDGSARVTVEIPQGGSGGIPDPGTAHLQLVSDENGKTVWQPRLAYTYTGQVEVLPETALTYAGPEDGVHLHLLTTPLPTMPEKGKTYNVVYNGTAYDCPVVYGYDEGGNGGQFILGNAMGEDGGNPDAPFTLIVLEDEAKGTEFGYYAMCAALDDATSVTISITQEGTAYKTINEEYLPASAVRKPITLTVATDDTVTADTEFNAAWAMGAQALMDAIVIKQGLADGTRTITPDNVELFENETGLQHICIRYSSFYYDMADQSQIPDRGKWMLWHANALQIQNGILPGFNPMNLGTSGTAQAGDYVRYEGNGLLRLVSIDQLKADLGLTGGETTTEDVFYTSDGQTFTTLDGAVLHVQKGEE